MTGKEAIMKKLLDDAEAYREQALLAAREKSREATEAAQKECEIARAEQQEANQQEYAAVVARKQTIAALEVKKRQLAVKQQIISQAFDAACARIVQLPDAQYKAFLGMLIEKYAEDGDRVVLAKADAGRISAADIAEIARKKNITLTLSDTSGSFSGGLLLEGRAYDKNLTVEAILRDCRKVHEAEIVSLLFE